MVQLILGNFMKRYVWLLHNISRFYYERSKEVRDHRIRGNIKYSRMSV